ncbi:MAG: MEKHLA domain-containing protein [Hyphomicrobiales bacterium]|nr:MEKHLA domain-containing protein [Hyphomicrobiales bacterium]
MVLRPFPPPSPDNHFLAGHARLLDMSLRRLTGRGLVPDGVAAADVGRWLFEAPFAVLSHNTDPDPVFTYGNLTALSLFELTWKELVRMPSRLSAEPLERAERARMFKIVAVNGFVDNYAGVRISRTGRRFRITGGTVWTMRDDDGHNHGQGATFSTWTFLADATA